MTTKLLYTPEEAAEQLSISRSKMYELLAWKEIASLHIGTSRRIPARALDEFIDRKLGDKDVAVPQPPPEAQAEPLPLDRLRARLDRL